MKYFSRPITLALIACLNGCSTLPRSHQCAAINDTASPISQVIEFDAHPYLFSFDLAFKLKSPTPDDLRELASALDVAHARANPTGITNTANIRTDFRFPLKLRITNLTNGSNKEVYDRIWSQLMYLGAGSSVVMTIDRIWLDPGKYKVDLTFLDGAVLPQSSNQVCFDIELPGKH